MSADFRKDFPNLRDACIRKTSDATDNYNCIAWAFKDSGRYWWPNNKRTYWPLKTLPNQTTMEAFESWFSADGWVVTSDREIEPEYEKIALYALRGVPKHAARLLGSGAWTSKLGSNIDISHELAELEGPCYGHVVMVYRKRAV